MKKVMEIHAGREREREEMKERKVVKQREARRVEMRFQHPPISSKPLQLQVPPNGNI